jgi:triphosphatase
LKSGRSFDRMTPHHRHELRKDLKKIRYLVELFGDLFELQRENKKYIRVVSLLQDQLGIFNDLSAAEEMIAKLNSGGEPAAIRAIGIMIGWCGRGATADDSSLRGAWKRFRKLEAIA